MWDGSDSTESKTDLGRTQQCPPLEALLRAQLDDRRDAEWSAILQHQAVCHYCQFELLLFWVFERTNPGPDELTAIAWITARMRVLAPGRAFRFTSRPS